MSLYFKLVFLASIFLLFFNVSQAQIESVRSKVTLTSRLLQTGQSIYTSDLVNVLPSGSESSPTEVIEVLASNIGDPRLVNLSAKLMKDGNLVSEGRTLKSALLKQGTTRITNLDFLNKGSKYFIGGFSTTLQEVQTAIFGQSPTESSGELPALLPNGLYQFVVAVYSPRNLADRVETTISILVSNPTGFVELLSPGRLVSESHIENFHTSFPVFSWTGDALEYEFEIWEDIRNSGEFMDVVNLAPSFKSKVVGTTFQYPSTAKELVPGKIYFWQVTGLLSTAFRQPRRVKSLPFVFRASSQGHTPLALKKKINEIFDILANEYDFNRVSLEGSSILDFTVIWGTKEKRSQDLDVLLKILNRR